MTLAQKIFALTSKKKSQKSTKILDAKHQEGKRRYYLLPIFTSDEGLFLQTIYHPLRLFASHCKGTALELFVDSPKYSSRRFGDVPYLDASAAYDKGTLVLNVVNRHRDRAIAAEIEAEDKEFSGPVSAKSATSRSAPFPTPKRWQTR